MLLARGAKGLKKKGDPWTVQSSVGWYPCPHRNDCSVLFLQGMQRNLTGSQVTNPSSQAALGSKASLAKEDHRAVTQFHTEVCACLINFFFPQCRAPGSSQ